MLQHHNSLNTCDGLKKSQKDSLLFVVFCLTEGLEDRKRNGITWTSSLDREIQNLTGNGKEKYSLKRLKHLHQEKVLTETPPAAVSF